MKVSNIYYENVEKIRNDMIKCGMIHGLVNEKTIRLSKKLDDILNHYEYSSFDSRPLQQNFKKND